MKKAIKLFGIIAIVAVIGFTTAACEQPTNEPAKVGVTLNKTSLSLTVGQEETLTATVTPADATNKAVTWSSSDTGKATVANGVVKAVAAGTAIITVTTADGNKTEECTVTVSRSPEKIEVAKQPTKTKFATGEQLDITGLEVTATYSGGDTEKVTITPENITGFNPNTEGEQTLTITYGGKTTTFKVTVIGVSKIEVTGQPTKTRFATDEQLDLTGLEVTATYSDNSTRTVMVTTGHITGFNPNTEGEQTLTITYGGKTTTFKVTVIGLSKIEVTKQPTKTKYAVGEQLDLTGLEVTATYSDTTTETVTVTAGHITGFNPNTTGEQTLTVTYGGKTATFKVTVIGLSKIEVTKQPDKTRYAVGEQLDLTGLEVTATYSDTTTETVTITAANITGFNSTNAGTKTLTVTYGGRTTTFTVTVVAIYTVTFNPNGGDWDGDTANKTVEVEPNATVAKPDDPQKDGFGFGGWYRDDSTFNNQWNFTTDTVTGNINLYAKWVSLNDADFGQEATIDNTFNVATTAEWNSALTTISGGGNDKNYIINVTDDFTVAGRTTNSFGAASGIKVSIRGEGKTLTLSSNGTILRIAANQTIILRDLTLKGRSATLPLVRVEGDVWDGTALLITYNVKISDQMVQSNYGAGVGVWKYATFIMNGGEISGNIAEAGNSDGGDVRGGGLFVAGTFIMRNNAVISGNTVRPFYSTTFTSYGYYGGGVYVEGTIRIEDGTIYGYIEGDPKSNQSLTYGSYGGWSHLGRGDALYKTTSATAQYGTFSGDKWNGTDLPLALRNSDGYTNDTIKVVNGVLQQ
ncbi:MAG: bacterial Ig-like domain-containing protein [Treponema sp.]|jgi:uncharacterized repeat protein (TIGR02543 family)|nr:bacterial Ig-like domain-containing protein [Treponema sp.]